MTESRLGLLLGAVLHDLQSPLDAAQQCLNSYIFQAKEPSLGLKEVAAESLRCTLLALRRMEQLSQDGIRLAALLSGETISLQREPCSLLTLLRTLHLEEPALVERLDWSVVTPDVRMEADPLCLYRVLANLLHNAHKYGGSRVRVTARVV